MNLEPKYLKMARELHQTTPVIDAHLDLAGELYFRLQNGEENPLRTHYLENLKTSGVDLLFSSIYIRDEELPEAALRSALDQISALLYSLDQNPEFHLIRTVSDIEHIFSHSKIGILLYMEGLDCIGKDLNLLRILWELGVRGASLTWSRRNALASGCCKGGEDIEIPGGLSPEGFLAVQEIERLGMFLDISHLNDDGFEDICQIATRSFVATHSNSRSVYPHYRNLTDTQMLKLSEKGGILGLNGCDCIAGTLDGADPLLTLCHHIEYEVSLLGPTHVGLGLDFCDSYTKAEPRFSYPDTPHDCLIDHSHLLELTAALLQRGMPIEHTKKILGENWLHYLKKTLPST